MIIILFCSAFIYLILFYCYEANLTNTPSTCNNKTDTCRILTDLIYIFITTLIPLILMIVFGLMTISNVRQAQRCIQPSIDPKVYSASNQEKYQKSTRTMEEDRSLFFLNVTYASRHTYSTYCANSYRKTVCNMYAI
jgi:hypothetical protein